MQRFRRSFVALLTGALVAGAVLAPLPAGAQAAGWQPGPGAMGDNTYDGFIDGPASGATVSTNGFTVNGWFVDTTAQGWAGADDIQVWLGTMDGGGKMLAKASIGQDRPDVATASGNPYWVSSGYSAFVGSGAVPAGSQTLYVYAHTPSKGWWWKSVSVNASSSAPAAAAPSTGTGGTAAPVAGGAAPILVIQAPKGAEIVKTSVDTFEVRGYALDPNATPQQGSQGTGIDKVQVYMDADKDDPKTIFIGDAELAFDSPEAAAAYGEQFRASGWRTRFKPTKFSAKGHQLFVYAHSVVTNKETLELRGFDIREP
jgi:hypothetical protein